MGFLRSMSLGAVIDVAVSGLAGVGKLSVMIDGLAKKAAGVAVSGLGSMATGFGAASVGAGVLSAGLLASGAAGIQAAASYEQTQMAFETMLGSADAATKHLGDLDAFAKKTPFQSEDLYMASRRMLAFGFDAEEVVPKLTRVGDAVAAMAGGAPEINQVIRALGQMKAKGKATAEEMNQLLEVGVFGWKDLAKFIGKSEEETMKLVEARKISADTVTAAFLQHSEDAFGGMMEKQSATFLGMLSNVQDGIAVTARTMFAPVIEALKPAVEMMNGFSAGMDADKMKAFGAGMAQALTFAIDLAKQGAAFLQTLMPAEGITGELAGHLGVATVAITLALAVATPLLGMLAAAALAAAMLGEVLVPVAGVILLGIAGAVAFVAMLFTVAESRGMSMGALLTEVMQGANDVWTRFRQNVENASGGLLTHFMPALNILRAAWEDIKVAFFTGTLGMGTFLGDLAGQLGFVVGIGVKWAGIAATMIAGGVRVVAWFAKVLGPALTVFAQGVLRVFTGIMTAIPAMIDAMVTPLVDNPVSAWALKQLGIEVPAPTPVEPGESPIEDILSGVEEENVSLVAPDVPPPPDTKVSVDLTSTVALDGKEVGRSTKKAEVELTERAGFSITPWQKRQIMESGATVLPAH